MKKTNAFPAISQGRWRRWAIGALAVPFAVAFWPAACTRAPTAAPTRAAAPSEPGALTESKASYGFLPHPAFARADNGTGAAASIADIAERTLPSVVNIASKRKVKNRAHPFMSDPFFRHFFGPAPVPKERLEQGLGSGVIVSKDGLILTNNHVVAEADEIRVATSEGREFDAEVVGTDEKSDLAVLRIESSGPLDLRPLSYGDSSQMRLGDVVLAVGNPFGVGQTVTMGIVSAKGRANMGIVDYEDFIQTDAAINPGNSGGALVNMKGELVGINTAILSRTGGHQGIGFAIPSNMARPIAESLLKHGKVLRGWLGVGIQDVDQALADAMGLGDTNGVLISQVDADSPAAKAGVKQGDVILSVDGQSVDSTGRLRNLIAAAGANRKVELELVRKGKKQSLSVQLGELPAATSETRAPDARSDAKAGMVLGELDATARQRYQVPQSVKSGVVIEQVTPGSTAAEAGLRPGDVILEIDRKPATNPSAAKTQLAKSSGNTLLLVTRGERQLFVVLKR